MSDEQGVPNDITREQFFEMVDQFVKQANEFVGKKMPTARVSAAILFAAARYNAFNWVTRGQLLEQTLDEAAPLFGAEYETMFRDNARDLGAVKR